MFRRLLLALVEGLFVGLALGVASTRLLGIAASNGVSSLLLGAAAGFLVGLIAGRPVWARDAKTEALLKATAGALGGAGLSFILRRWLGVEVDLSALALGVGPAGQLPALALPAVGTLLALFFELDDDGPRVEKSRPAPLKSKQRVDASMDPAVDQPEANLLADDEGDRKLEKR